VGPQASTVTMAANWMPRWSSGRLARWVEDVPVPVAGLRGDSWRRRASVPSFMRRASVRGFGLGRCCRMWGKTGVNGNAAPARLSRARGFGEICRKS
jgi:hypothetical protein